MTQEAVLKILKAYYDIDYCITLKGRELLRIQKQKDMIYAPVSNINGVPRSGGTNDPVFEKVWALQKQFEKDIARISKEIVLLQLRKQETEHNVSKLEPLERSLISLRYFHKKKWFVIERELNYAQRQPFNIHKKIIKWLAENWETVDNS